MSIQLRKYQTSIIDEARAYMRAGERAILIQSATGSGKTALTAHMLHAAASKGMRSWFCVHRRELIKQSMKAFDTEGLRYGVIAAGFYPDPKPLAQICSIQTLSRRLKSVQAPNLIVWDECSHIASASWGIVHSKFQNAYHVGLTATPERLDGKGLGKWFNQIVNGPTVQWLIENGFLAKYALYAPSTINISGVRTRMGDYAQDDLAKAVDKNTITGDAVSNYLKYVPGKRAIVFCVSIEHSKHVAEQFSAAGIASVHVDGQTDHTSRDYAVACFTAGTIKVLCSVDLFSEGFDVPAMEASILLRPTASLALYLQQVGRVLRPYPGKTQAVILDHCGNYARHGLPDDPREWSLEGKSGRRKGSSPAVSVRICPKCFAAQAQGTPSCRFCGAIFDKNPRQVEQVDGDLDKVDIEKLRITRKREQGRAQTLEDLIAVGKSRGYKRPELWGRYVWNARIARMAVK